MKKIILLALAALMMVGCSEQTDKSTELVQFKILEIDSCEYLKVNTIYGCTHKGNCRFCAERRKQEVEALIEQLKKK